MTFPPRSHPSTSNHPNEAKPDSPAAPSVSMPDAQPPRHSASKWILRVAALAGAGALGFAGVIAMQVVRQAPKDETRPAGAIIVFGAAEYAGRPSPVYRARLDHAYDLFQRGVAPLVITSGGAAHDPKYTEGGVGHDYLHRRGIPDINLIAETQSDDTADSAQRTAAILRANHIGDCVAVSDAYHMLRVKKLLQEQGVVVYASPRPDSIPHSTWGRMITAAREGLSYLVYRIGLG